MSVLQCIGYIKVCLGALAYSLAYLNYACTAQAPAVLFVCVVLFDLVVCRAISSDIKPASTGF